MIQGVDYTTLKALKVSEFEDAADGYRAASSMASQVKDRIENEISAGMRRDLDSEASDAAARELKELATNFHYTQIECGLISTALNALAADLTVHKKALDAAVADAEAAGFTVLANGAVQYPAGGDKVDGKVPEGGTVTGSAKGAATGAPIDPAGDANDLASALERQAANIHPNPNFGRAVEFANRIAQAVSDATDADAKWAPKLRALKADDDLKVSKDDWADVTTDTGGVRSAAQDYVKSITPPPKDGTAAQNAEWWKGLSPEEQATHLSLNSAAVGAMDGLPATVRDEANRAVLRDEHSSAAIALQKHLAGEPKRLEMKYTLRGDPIGERETDEWKKWNEERKRLQGRVDGMGAIQSRFDATGKDGLPEAYLLGFDPEGMGKGKVILANGNPDTADHTAVYVPGTGTNLPTIEGDLNRSEELWRQSNKMAAGATVSTITWFDYDAPLSAMPYTDGGGLLPEAMYDDQAAEGGPNLRAFLDGNREAHLAASGDKGHTTLMGHSYGTTLIGDAVKSYSPGFFDGPLKADDIIAVGSPGMQADHAADLGVERGHMWAMAAPASKDQVPLAGSLVGLGDHGVVPTDPEFGANIMKTDAEDHSDYWRVNEDNTPSTSLKNQARIIVGDYGKVSLE
ncbi:alpha/beta hydrolase [Streptomyces sp. NPDC057116]|uniref:alpha/beta hydrolase n=1 Tax=Streptomyces sp. NPDC057116 TaxID=3346023 RepID=UPI003625BC66